MTSNVKRTPVGRITGLFPKLPENFKLFTGPHIGAFVSIAIGLVFDVLGLHAGDSNGLMVAGIATVLSIAIAYGLNMPEKSSAMQPKAKSTDKTGLPAARQSKEANILPVATGNSLAAGYLVSFGIAAVVLTVWLQSFFAAVLILGIIGSTGYYLQTTVGLKTYFLNPETGRKLLFAFRNIIATILYVFYGWLPLRFALYGSWRQFFFGPLCKKSGVLIPKVVIPYTNTGLQLSLLKIEAIDILYYAYCVWILYLLYGFRYYNPNGFSVVEFSLSLMRAGSVLTVLLLLNKDGTKWRIAAIMLIMYFGYSAEVQGVKAFAIKSGWLSLDSIVLNGANGTTLEILIVVMLVIDIFLQPVWNWFVTELSVPLGMIRETVEMKVVRTTSSEIKEGALPSSLPVSVRASHYNPGLPELSKQGTIEMPVVVDTSVVSKTSDPVKQIVPPVVGSQEHSAPPTAMSVSVPPVSVSAASRSEPVEIDVLTKPRTETRQATVISLDNEEHRGLLKIIMNAVDDLSQQQPAYVLSQVKYLCDKLKFEDEVLCLQEIAKILEAENKHFKFFKDLLPWLITEFKD